MILLPAQDHPTKPVHRVHQAAKADERPVTEREARAAFVKLGDLLLRVNGKPLGTPSIQASDRPVSRAEVVAEMGRLYTAAGSTIRFIPAPARYDVGKFRIDRSVQPGLARLVGLGFVGKVSPLAVGPSDTLTANQFGDALGLFASRLAQMTHLPSPKWTPFLKED